MYVFEVYYSMLLLKMQYVAFTVPLQGHSKKFTSHYGPQGKIIWGVLNGIMLFQIK